MGKGEQTRRLIVDTAIGLFAEHGYEKTTMRSISSAAGVSVGNAYYYFPSKETLVQEFYLQLQRQHAALVEPILQRDGGFSAQLLAIFEAGLTLWAPYHEFAGRFIGLAAVPGSPNSPFSPESAEARDASLAIFERLVSRTPLKMAPEVKDELPGLLWLTQLGMVTYWVHDNSPQQARTQAIIETAVPYLERLIGLSRLKVLRPVTLQGLALYRQFRR